MIKKIILLNVIMICILSCNNRTVDFLDNQKYIEAKNSFSRKLVDHFPKMLTSYPFQTVNSKNKSKSDVCFMLYEYEKDLRSIDSVVRSLEKKSLAKYSSNDSCLLIVNRFETLKTYKNREDVTIADSTKMNQDCFKDLYPIPNFIEYEFAKGKNEIYLENNFDIYVLEAKKGNCLREFKMMPNPQMPANWKNGYSKGIAVSRERKTLIYWSVIW
ncbi:hypothetical protein [Flavobacterium daemonense]|uniref:hypothetical protein n=1 Tax=Flavobacterium daemonense TaxID=1393049 RepID=UPI00118504F2|nr:hypothetical protein [Flavobacterium daemonense]KAF2335742.1 hypothetical protein FND99_06170 [Flavobacterium daemonense]